MSTPTADQLTGADAESTGHGALNLLTDFPDLLAAAITSCVPDPSPQTDPEQFSPGYALPEPDDALRRFLSVATAGWHAAGSYRGHPLTLLDLAGNPGTNTTKTFPSLLIVARAVEYIRRTGEPVMIFSPTSANKGVALRDAVWRAVSAGLVTPEQLRVAVLAPASCRAKLRSDPLSTDDGLRELNPLLLYTGEQPEQVKALGREFVTAYAAAVLQRTGARLWYSLDLRNYLVADTARAFVEQRVAPTDEDDQPRLHAHAVSSAFGMLGYHQGREVLEQAGLASAATRPATLLVQHLGTPDMVLNLRFGDFDRSHLPRYEADPGGQLRQCADPHFPQVTADPGEVLDPTFYTHRPVTSPAMNAIINRFGGDGIVVSRAECLERYDQLRALLADTPRRLPADPATLREWSLVMALTGVCNAIDRGLVEPDRAVVVHGSGSYSTADFTPLPDPAIHPVRELADVAAVCG